MVFCEKSSKEARDAETGKKKGAVCMLCAGMAAALLSGCGSNKTESSKPSIHIETYTKVGYDTATVQSGDIAQFWNWNFPRINLKRKRIKFSRMIMRLTR